MKNKYTLEEVRNIIEDVLNAWYNMDIEFDKRLNERWLNNNWNTKDNLRYIFLYDFINNLLK